MNVKPRYNGKQLPITVLIAARNEEANIDRCLEALAPAERVIVVDSHSSDSTVALARHRGADIIQFNYAGGYPKKRQWALLHADIRTEWTFLLDADEVVPLELWDEIQNAITHENTDAFLITKGFHFMNRRFRWGGFSHAAVLLFRTGCAQFEEPCIDVPTSLDMEVHERLLIDGKTDVLHASLIHDDFKGLEAYIHKHKLYAEWEARFRGHFLRTGSWGGDTIRPRLLGTLQERRRFLKSLITQAPFEPAIWFAYHYIIRLGVMEGQAGFTASLIRARYIADVRHKMKANMANQIHSTCT